MPFPRETVYPRTPACETQRGTRSDGSLVDHSFQLANANTGAIDPACDNLSPGEVQCRFNSPIHQLTRTFVWLLTSRLFTRSLSAWV